MGSLFKLFKEPIILKSGKTSHYKIDCDALTEDDWRALALIAVERLPLFGSVEPVPRGGIPFADALRFYATPETSDTILIAEDVVTTGGSMEKVRAGREKTIGVCVFARGVVPSWVTPLFQMRT